MDSVHSLLPDPDLIWVAFVVSIVFSVYQWYQTQEEAGSSEWSIQSLEHLKANPLSKRIIKVSDNVFIAAGYGSTNCVLIEGHDGCTLLNTLDSFEVAVEVKAAFTHVTKKPLKTIVLTRYHPSFVTGLPIWIEGEKNPQIWVHESFEEVAQEFLLPASKQRLIKYFRQPLAGPLLMEFDHVPLKHLGLSQKIDGSGISLELVHLDGIARDEIGIWWPGPNIFFAGDSIGLEMPDLYPLEGGPHRDVLRWVKAVEKVAGFEPDALVLTHARPIVMREEARELLDVLRTSVKFIHDQTIRHMNNGLFPEQICQNITVPPRLSSHPIWQNSSVPTRWIIRGVFNFYMGWFSGKASELNPTQGGEWVQLLGGTAQILGLAQKACDQDELEWSLYLLDTLSNTLENEEVASAQRDRLLHALMLRLSEHPSLSKAEERSALGALAKTYPFPSDSTLAVPENLSLAECHMILRSRVDANKFPERFHKRANLVFADRPGLNIHLEIRNSVLVIKEGPVQIHGSPPEFSIKLGVNAWKNFCVHGTLDEEHKAYYSKFVGLPSRS